MSTHSPLPTSIRKRTSPRARLFLLATSLATAVAILSCPLTQDALSKTPSTDAPGAITATFTSAVTTAPSRIFSRTVPARSVDTGFWHTEGSRIVTAAGQTVRISGANWSGFETTNMVPGGLEVQDYRRILRGIRAAGYNTVRIPFSNQMIESPVVPKNIRFEDASGRPMNQDLASLDSLEILDHLVDAARETGLKVILDNHRSEAGSSAEANGLWYTAQYPESAWIADWTALAARYKGNSTVVGFDLRNEPHNATQGGSCWSCGGATDWHLAATRAGNAILRTNSSLLIFVEGTDTTAGESDFWGGNLAGVRSAPVHLTVPGRLVYSVHVYGPTEYQQSWFNAATTPASLAALYSRHWGFISETGLAPVWIGEFGTPNTDSDVASTEPGSEGQWFGAFVAYLASHPEIGWSYWGINGEDRYGLLDASYNATPANALKAQALASIRLPRTSAASFVSASVRPAGSRSAASIATPASSVSVGSPASVPSREHARQATPVTGARSASAHGDAAVQSSVAEQVRLATARALGSIPAQAE